MIKFIMLIMIFSSIGSIFGAIADTGEAQMATTRLAGNVNPTQTYIKVDNIDGFSDYGVIKIDNEYISYSSIDTNATLPTVALGCYQLSNCTRAEKRTNASSHKMGSTVYSLQLATMNDGYGSDYMEAQTNVGNMNSYSGVKGFLLHTVPRTLTWNFCFMDNEYFQYTKIILIPLSIGGFIFFFVLMITIIYTFFSGNVGLLGKITRGF